VNGNAVGVVRGRARVADDPADGAEDKHE